MSTGAAELLHGRAGATSPSRAVRRADDRGALAARSSSGAACARDKVALVALGLHRRC